MEEPIHSSPINRLPESLILQCLARLHLKDLPVASGVCRKWLHLVESRHFYTLRKQLRCTNQVACLLQQQPCTPPSFYNLKYGINVFDPMNREWNRLPPIPNFPNEFPWTTSIASSGGKLVVFIDCGSFSRDPKSMFVLDFATQRWRKSEGMPLISSCKFSMVSSKCHRIFIIGDRDGEKGAVWEYDVWKDEWTVLHRVRDGHIIRMRVIGDELWVIFGCGCGCGCRVINESSRLKEHGADVYHLQTEKWRRIELDLAEFVELLCPQPDYELYELMKRLCENNLIKVLQECCRLQLGKQSLLMAPTVKDGCYDREEFFYMQSEDGNLERMQPSSSEFSRHVGSYCCVEL